MAARIARSVGIWLTGMAAAAFIGGSLEQAINAYGTGGMAIGSTLAFICLRLWLGERRQISN